MVLGCLNQIISYWWHAQSEIDGIVFIVIILIEAAAACAAARGLRAIVRGVKADIERPDRYSICWSVY